MEWENSDSERLWTGLGSPTSEQEPPWLLPPNCWLGEGHSGRVGGLWTRRL